MTVIISYNLLIHCHEKEQFYQLFFHTGYPVYRIINRCFCTKHFGDQG